MRARNLKPGFFKNEDLAEIEPLGRILFQGLWCMADREGRLEDRPKRIKAEVLPYDNCNIERLLSVLHERQFIIRYLNGTNKYIQISNFLKHQYPHMKEAESTIPAPDLHQISTGLEPDENRSSPSESFNLNPESLEPISCSSSPKTGDGFDVFWNAYPRKIGKQAALLAWKKTKNKPPINKILKAIQNQCEWEQWQEAKYIPHPATWINQGRWDDEPTTVRVPRWMKLASQSSSPDL